jgi:hypothetical protein
MVSARLLPVVLVSIFLIVSSSAQNERFNPPGEYPFLVHLETMNFDSQACVLLRHDGRFHLEEEKGDRTRVFEGTLSVSKISEVQKMINAAELLQMSQKQIAPPRGNIMLDQLYVDIFRGDHWQELFFPDESSRKPFESAISPLVRWLEALRKEPHTEISEDAGRNQCQLPKLIVLKRRTSPKPR